MALAGLIALIEVILFVMCLRYLKSAPRCNYFLGLLTLMALLAFVIGSAFNQHYYVELLQTTFGSEEAFRHHETILYKLREFFTLSSTIGLTFSAITVAVRLWQQQRGLIELDER